MRETILDLHNTVREMPWFAAVVALLVAIGAGVNACILDEADGDHVLVSASRIDDQTARLDESVKARLMGHRCATKKIPGFTVVVALRQYSLELSVPVHGVDSLVEDSRATLRGALDVIDLQRAA